MTTTDASPDEGEEYFDLMDQDQSAEYIHRETGTLSYWRWRGEGPRYVRIGNRVFYRRAWLNEFLTAQIVDPKQRTRPIGRPPKAPDTKPRRPRGRPRKVAPVEGAGSGQ